MKSSVYFAIHMKFSSSQGLGKNRSESIGQKLSFEDLRWTVFTLSFAALCYLLTCYLRADINGDSFIGINGKIWCSLNPCKYRDNSINGLR